MVTKKIVHVGVDVDDTAYHVKGIVLETGEFFEFQCKPDAGVLRKRLREIFGERYEIRICCEACYIGYTLYRFLRKEGIHCDIIAPSLIPVKAGTRVKTDRLDAAKLAEYCAKGLLTSIHVPNETRDFSLIFCKAS
jgi:transposase